MARTLSGGRKGQVPLGMRIVKDASWLADRPDSEAVPGIASTGHASSDWLVR
jgi:hypothetical protein